MGELFRESLSVTLTHSNNPISQPLLLTQKLYREPAHNKLVTLLAEPDQYPSFSLLTLKTTGLDGKYIKPKGSILRLPAWPRFLDRADEQNPYVRQYNAL